MALPASFAINLQGFIIVVGSMISLDILAVFVTVRTLTRSVIQAALVVNGAIIPELSRACGGGDTNQIANLRRFNVLAVTGINAIAFVGVAIAGSPLIAFWTGGRISPDPWLVCALAAVAAVHSFWLSQSNLILAINRHSAYPYWFLTVTIISVLVSVAAAYSCGLGGVVVTPALSECVMLIVVSIASRRVFGDITVS